MSTSLSAYRDEFAIQAAKPVFKDQQTTGLSFNQFTQWFDVAPLTRPNVLAAYFKFSYTTSGTITTVSGADQLDAVIQQVQVSPAKGLGARSQAITRKGMEDIEQVTFNVNYGYPRTAVTTAGGTFTPFLYVPVGGEAGAIRFQMASGTAAYSGGTVALNSVTCYVIEGDSDLVVTFNEQNTPSLGSGLQNMRPYLRDDIAPDIVIMEGEDTSTVTFLNMADQNGRLLIAAADVDAAANGAAAFAPIVGAPKNGLGLVTQEAVPTIFQATFASATTHDILEVQYYGPPQAVSQPTQVTPATPAHQSVGVQNAAGVPVPANSKAAGSLGTIRRPRF